MDSQDIRDRHQQLLDDYHSNRIDWKAFERGLFELKQMRSSSANIIDAPLPDVSEQAAKDDSPVSRQLVVVKPGRFDSGVLPSEDGEAPVTPAPFPSESPSGISSAIRATGTLQPQRRNGRLNAGIYLTEHYRLQRLLGIGLCGETWLALEMDTGNFVNVKTLPLSVQEDKEAVQAFRYAVRRTSKLRFPGISPVYKTDYDEYAGLFLVTAYLDAMPLNRYREQYLQMFPNFPMTAAIRILWSVAKSLDFAHQKGIVHRALKSSNVLVGNRCGVATTDFYFPQTIQAALSRRGRSPDNFESERYAAPEVLSHQSYSSKSDQFSLAVIAVQLISGSLPFQGDNIGKLRESVLSKVPILPKGLSKRVTNALHKALSKEPENRFCACLDFVAELAEFDVPAVRSGKMKSRLQNEGLWATFGSASLPEPNSVAQATLADIFPFKDWKSPDVLDSVQANRATYPYQNPPSAVSRKKSRSSFFSWRNLTLAGLLTVVVGIGACWGLPALKGYFTAQKQVEGSPEGTTEGRSSFSGSLPKDLPASRQSSLDALGDKIKPVSPMELTRLVHASSESDSDALRRLGEVYFFGKGVRTDFDKALGYFAQGADLGDAASLFFVGHYYESGFGDVQKDLPRAVEMYKKSAAKGYQPATERLRELERNQ